MKHIFLILFLLILILIFQACKENVITYEPTPVKVSIESILPNHALKIGERFRIIVKVENLDNASIDHRFYINDQFHYDNTVNWDTIFTYLPYIPSNSNEWTIKVSAYSYNGSEFIYYDGHDTINVIPENYFPGVGIKWSDLDNVIEEDSYFLPSIFGDQYKWTSEKNGDTIIISQITPNSDDELAKEVLKLIDKGSNKLPEFLEFTKTIYFLDYPRSDTLKSGVIKIQSWDTTGIISGIILSELEPINPLKPILPTRKVFWCNYSK